MTVEESGQRGNTSGEENRIERYIRTDGTSVAEPEPRFFLSGAGADILGRLRLLFLASEK